MNEVPFPLQAVVDFGASFWEKTLIGFILDDGLPYAVVRRHLRAKWKLKSSLKVRFDNDLYHFDFGNDEERRMVLEVDLCIIDGNVFIITCWSPN